MGRLADLKRDARQAKFGLLGEPVFYTDRENLIARPTAEEREAGLALTCRWHNKNRLLGELDNDSVAIMEGVERLVFDAAELAALDLKLVRGGEVVFPDLDLEFRLDQPERSDGPVNVYWSVTRES